MVTKPRRPNGWSLCFLQFFEKFLKNFFVRNCARDPLVLVFSAIVVAAKFRSGLRLFVFFENFQIRKSSPGAVVGTSGAGSPCGDRPRTRLSGPAASDAWRGMVASEASPEASEASPAALLVVILIGWYYRTL